MFSSRMSVRLLLCAISISALRLASGASDAEPHFHHGKLTPYEIGPPSILLSPSDESRLADGEAIMQAIVHEDGETRRLLMVKDVRAPADVIAGRLLDIDAYPRMVKGCDQTTTYEVAESEQTGRKEIKTKYKIHAMHMKFTCACHRHSLQWRPHTRVFCSCPHSCASMPDPSLGPLPLRRFYEAHLGSGEAVHGLQP
jgi:hypothetical protein